MVSTSRIGKVLKISGLNGTAWTLPGLRFAAQVTLEPRKARFWLLASFARWGWLPTGSHREVSGLLCHPIPPAQAWPGALQEFIEKYFTVLQLRDFSTELL